MAPPREDPGPGDGRAGIGPGAAVLDLCCGIGGPGRHLRELGCGYLGVDASASAVAIARERAGEEPCRFAIAQVPPLPARSFDVVLLLETMLAFEDKDALVREISAVLRPGGRFAFTLEAGPPLTTAERAAMPDADTVWLTPLDEMATCPGAGRARRHVAGGPQPRAPRDGARAGGRVRRGRRGHRGADRPPGAGRVARRPPALDRVAGRGAGAEARAGGAAGLVVHWFTRPACACGRPPRPARPPLPRSAGAARSSPAPAPPARARRSR